MGPFHLVGAPMPTADAAPRAPGGRGWPKSVRGGSERREKRQRVCRLRRPQDSARPPSSVLLLSSQELGDTNVTEP